MSYTVKQMPEGMRPRERLVSEGESAMSPAELIAILLGSGTQGKPVTHLAEELLVHFGDLDNLTDASIGELTQIQGMGPAKAVQLRAAFALARRIATSHREWGSPIHTASDAYQILRIQLESQREERIAVLLHTAKGLAAGVHLVSIGTVTRALAHPREIFYPAIRHKAAALTVAHNHPSGDPSPSEQDLTLTRKLVGVSRLLEILLFDHLVIGSCSYTSIRQSSTIWQ